jgi:putative NADH-flavin reductase
MHVVIFGATGKTGRQLVTQALELGHTITAVARHPGGVAVEHDRLHVVQASFEDQAAIEAAIRGHDAVLSAVGAPQSRKPTTVHADSARSICAAMEATGVQRLICVTSGGTNPQHDPALPFIFEQIFKRIYANIYRDQQAMEQIVTESALDWTIVRPAGLTDAPPTGQCRVAEGYALPGGSRTPRSDLAAFMLQQLESCKYVRKAVALAL